MKYISCLFLMFTILNGAELKIISQNVYFDDQSGMDGRYDKLLDEIKRYNSDVIAFQEVTMIFEKLLSDYASKNDYKLHGNIKDGYGNITLIKNKKSTFQEIPLPTRMNRKAILSIIPLANTNVYIFNVHLDSMLNDAERRIMQLDKIMNFKNDIKYIILGDFNFGDNDNEYDKIKSLNDFMNDKGYTYDTVNNKLAQFTKFETESSRRIDRIIGNIKVEIIESKILTNENSDHYGIYTKIKFD